MQLATLSANVSIPVMVASVMTYEYDHITPFLKGGESVADNYQILQTRV